VENNQNEMKCLSDMSLLRGFQRQIPEQLKGQKAKIFIWFDRTYKVPKINIIKITFSKARSSRSSKLNNLNFLRSDL
jgi:hypothetical protein